MDKIAFGSYRGIAYLKKIITHKGPQTREANQRGERRPASSPGHRGQWQIVSAGTAGEAIALETPCVAGTATRPHAGSSDRGTAIEVLSDVVTWSVLVWFARQREIKKLGLQRPCNLLKRCGWSTPCLGPSDLALRLLRWSCLSGIVDLTCEEVDHTTHFALLASVSGTCHVELDQLPNLNNTKSKSSPKRLLSGSFFFVISDQMSNGLRRD